MAPKRVFIGRLAGIEVFDPIGDSVGKVVDVVVVFRMRYNPLAVGLVVNVTGKRRVFMPLTRVRTIENGQVISTGLVNLRRFAKRPSETLVVSEVFDREVTFKDGSGKASIEDVAIQQENREWRVTELYVRMAKGSPDAGKTKIVPADSVTWGTTALANQEVASVLSQLQDLKAQDAADLLRDLPASRVLQIANQMDDDRLADVLEEMGESDRVAIVSGLDVERAANVLDEMEPDDAADLINELSDKQAEILLARMEPDEAEDVRRLMSYGERTAGGLMTTDPIVLSPDSTVATLLAHARRQDIPPALSTIVFISRPPLETPTGRFLGVVHLQQALRNPPATMIGHLMESVEQLHPDDGIGTVTRLLATYDLTALPVVDHGLLVGAVSVDDVLDHLLPDDWREVDEQEIDDAVAAKHTTEEK
ncbi:MAG: CBS domain-containing protein [Trueperella sp.]|nr:CBS domain-containing protein [Trueperella sp.]